MKKLVKDELQLAFSDENSVMKILDSLLVAVQVIYFIFIQLLSHCFEVLQSFYDASSQLSRVDLVIYFLK